MPNQGRGGRGGRGDIAQNNNRNNGGRAGRRGGDGQNQPCKWCNKKNHASNDCHFNKDKPSNNPRNGGGHGGNAGKGNHPNICDFCQKPMHIAADCFKNPESSKFKRPGRKGGSGSNPNQTCATCGKPSHLKSNCRMINGMGGNNGLRPPKGPPNPLGLNITGNFGQPVPIDGSSDTFISPEHPFTETQTAEADFAPQLKSNGKWNRKCKDCQQWHADCGKGDNSNKDTKVVDSDHDSDDEQEEPRLLQVMPSLQQTGRVWPFPRTGWGFDVDSEGDIIMLETVNAPLPYVQTTQNFADTK